MVLLDHLGHPDISLAVDQLILELGVRVGHYPDVAGVFPCRHLAGFTFL